MDWKKESEMFDRAADYYDRYRPGYPREVIDRLIQFTAISAGSRLLEIGAGSGKATEQFCGGSFYIDCIEPGKELVKIGNARFHDEQFNFIGARFEEYDVLPLHYDAVFSAQAFHWIPQPVGYEKCAEALKTGGFLALLWNMYVVSDTEADRELLAISDRYGGIADFLTESECERRISLVSSSVENSGLFTKPRIYKKECNCDYTPDDYFGFMLTGNAFIQKSDEVKDRAYRDIKQLAARHGGMIRRPYLCVLYVSQKL